MVLYAGTSQAPMDNLCVVIVVALLDVPIDAPLDALLDARLDVDAWTFSDIFMPFITFSDFLPTCSQAADACKPEPWRR